MDISAELSPSEGQSPVEAFEASLWATAFMGEAEPVTRIHRGETGEAIGHTEVLSW